MNRIKSLISISAFSLLVLSLPVIALAQSRDRDRDDDRYGNNGGYNNGGNNNGQYGNYGGNSNGQYGNYGADMRSTIRNLKNRAKDFQKQLDRELDNSRYNGSRREDQMNELAKRFKDAVNDLDSNGYNNSGYGNNGRYGNNNRGDSQMRRVGDLASQIDRSIIRSGVSYQSQNIWSGIRRDLQTLGAGYGGYNNNNNRNGNNNGGWGNGRSNKPSWWPF